MQLTRRFTGSDWRHARGKNGTAVKTGFHLHQAYTCFAVTFEYRLLNGRRTAPARQYRCMHIDATMTGNIQHRLRQNESVCRHHDGIGLHVDHLADEGRIFERLWLPQRNFFLQRKLLDRAGT